MDLLEVRKSAAEFHGLPEDRKTIARYQMDVALTWLEQELPALALDDRAACAWIVAQIMSALMYAPVREASELVEHTAIAYALAACKLHGLIEDVS